MDCVHIPLYNSDPRSPDYVEVEVLCCECLTFKPIDEVTQVPDVEPVFVCFECEGKND